MRSHHPLEHMLEKSRDRRSFIRSLAFGTAGLSLLGGKPAPATTPFPLETRSRLTFRTGSERRDLIYDTVLPFRGELEEAIGDKQVIIKPNLIDPVLDPPITNVEAVRGVLDVVTRFHSGEIIIGDSTGRPGGTMECIRNHNYLDLKKDYNVKLIDFNDTPTTTLQIIDRNFHPMDIDIISLFLNPDNYIISVTRPKTHNNVVATMSVKNTVMASPVNVIRNKHRLVRGQKTKMHDAGNRGLHFNIFQVGMKVQPSFSVIDGIQGMEGNGPSIHGDPIDHGFAVAGHDMLSVDRLTAEMMGVDFGDLGYLNYLAWAGQGQADLAKIDIDGPDYRPHIKQYRMHDDYENLLDWKEGLVMEQL